MGKMAKNDITHAEIKTTYNSNEYRENYSRIFGESKLEKKLKEESGEISSEQEISGEKDIDKDEKLV